MPYRQVHITQGASEELYREFSAYIQPGVYDTEKGDIGAVLARYIHDRIGLAVRIARDNGCYTETPADDIKNSEPALERSIEIPKQLDFGLRIYDETSHLTAEGKRRH